MIKLLVTSDLFIILGVIGKIFAATAWSEQDLKGDLDHNNELLENDVFTFDEKEHWSYENQENWGGMCNTGKRQSPIELDFDVAEEWHFPPFNFSNAEKPYNLVINFNGHTVTVNFRSGGGSSVDGEDTVSTDNPSFTGGGYSGTYIFDHLHFHWNSEHTINNYRHPLEAHLVHYKKEYVNLTEAKNHGDGIAVLATVFDLSPDDDAFLALIMNDVKTTGHSGNSSVTSKHQLTYNNFIPRDTAGFFRYRGSLTTPKCEEAVIWTVFTNTVPISLDQLKVFQNCKLSSGSRLEKNYRDLQDINNRRIYVKLSPIDYSNGKNLKSSAFSVMPFLYILWRYF